MKKVIEFISYKIISPFTWSRLKYLLVGREYDLTAQDREMLRAQCELGVFLWVTRRETHLTTYLITLSDYALSLNAWARNKFKGPMPKLGFYAHAFFNSDRDSFIEATSKGVNESYFDEVFNVDAVAALAPAGLSVIEWSMFSKKFVEVGKSKLGAKYDTLFNLKDESEVSCIELVRVALRHCMPDADYNLRFKNFEALIAERRNLTPDMLRYCKDFEVILEMRR